MARSQGRSVNGGRYGCKEAERKPRYREPVLSSTTDEMIRWGRRVDHRSWSTVLLASASRTTKGAGAAFSHNERQRYGKINLPAMVLACEYVENTTPTSEKNKVADRRGRSRKTPASDNEDDRLRPESARYRRANERVRIRRAKGSTSDSDALMEAQAQPLGQSAHLKSKIHTSTSFVRWAGQADMSPAAFRTDKDEGKRLKPAGGEARGGSREEGSMFNVPNDRLFLKFYGSCDHRLARQEAAERGWRWLNVLLSRLRFARIHPAQPPSSSIPSSKWEVLVSGQKGSCTVPHVSNCRGIAVIDMCFARKRVKPANHNGNANHRWRDMVDAPADLEAAAAVVSCTTKGGPVQQGYLSRARGRRRARYGDIDLPATVLACEYVENTTLTSEKPEATDRRG
ncbi:hypothetical protein GALMADRAFT_205338 [Galerina marginata CBS 339.88]|uniref:Uncharacterized protein n=1 Tax=Galerina marginata (strain CBS 339.88) TaxID=685588 RepID=A0A067U1K7_GALM3|nr:hypothetical protein GALMADRAFT_205338 [Galerina marginata CBS 339.88]